MTWWRWSTRTSQGCISQQVNQRQLCKLCCKSRNPTAISSNRCHQNRNQRVFLLPWSLLHLLWKLRTQLTRKRLLRRTSRLDSSRLLSERSCDELLPLRAWGAQLAFQTLSMQRLVARRCLFNSWLRQQVRHYEIDSEIPPQLSWRVVRPAWGFLDCLDRYASVSDSQTA